MWCGYCYQPWPCGNCNKAARIKKWFDRQPPVAPLDPLPEPVEATE